ncbi:MAG TPA: cupin domain-containing protein [Prosthecobacter sp.]
MSLSPALVPAGQGRLVRAFGEELQFHLTGAETGGAYAQWVETTPPGGGPPPHYHTGEDEWFYVLEGTVSFFKDGAWSEVGPGAGAYLPRNSVHTFKNTGETPLRMVVTVAPAGFETFMTRCEEVWNQPGAPDMERILQISAEHGIHFVAP